MSNGLGIKFFPFSSRFNVYILARYHYFVEKRKVAFFSKSFFFWIGAWSISLHLSFFSFLTHLYFLFKIFLSIMVYPRRLDIVPCAIQ